MLTSWTTYRPQNWLYFASSHTKGPGHILPVRGGCYRPERCKTMLVRETCIWYVAKLSEITSSPGVATRTMQSINARQSLHLQEEDAPAKKGVCQSRIGGRADIGVLHQHGDNQAGHNLRHKRLGLRALGRASEPCRPRPPEEVLVVCVQAGSCQAYRRPEQRTSRNYASLQTSGLLR